MICTRYRIDYMCLFLALSVLTGCALPGRKARIDAVRTVAQPFGECIHLSNGTVDVVLSPQTGRIVGFGWTGERNLLWLDTDADRRSKNTGGWFNWGGSRTWIWPRDDWRRITGEAWPPPLQADGLPHVCRVGKGGRQVVMRSGVVGGYGMRVTREIILADKAPVLEVPTRLEKSGPAPDTSPWTAPWTVTQLPIRNQGVYARLVEREPERVLYPSAGSPALPEPGRHGRVLSFGRLKPTTARSGLEADLLAVRFADTLFVQRVTRLPRPALFRPGERAAISVSGPAQSPGSDDSDGWIGLEFTGPLVDRTDAKEGQLTIQWMLIRLTPGAGEYKVIDTLGGL